MTYRRRTDSAGFFLGFDSLPVDPASRPSAFGAPAHGGRPSEGGKGSVRFGKPEDPELMTDAQKKAVWLASRAAQEEGKK